MYVAEPDLRPAARPARPRPEVAGPIDLATTAAEVCLVGVLLTMLGPVARRRVLDLLVAFAVLLWALRLSGRLP